MSYKEYIKGNKQDDWIDYIIQSLQGTCGSLSEFLNEYLDEGFDEIELCEAIDANIYQCEECGWWVEVSETNELGICESCQEDE